MKEDKLITYQWAIAIYKGDSPFNLKPIEGLSETVLTFEGVDDIEASFVADPFMICVQNSWYMFFEVLNSKTGLGEIGYAMSPDGFNWKYMSIVLKDQIHLSYPFIFENEGDFYMVPETRQAGEIRIYKAKEFPHQWEVIQVILKGNYADATLVKYQEKWWMFALHGTKDLHLFYSDSILGDWIPHSSNPIIENDLKSSRPAGRIIHYNNKLYRLAQDGYPLYGNKVGVFEILEMNTESYREFEIIESPILKGSRNGWNSVAMHHVDAHKVDKNLWIACVDGAKPNFTNLIEKFKNKKIEK